MIRWWNRPTDGVWKCGSSDHRRTPGRVPRVDEQSCEWGIIFTGGIYSAAAYDPGTSGAINELDFSIDLTIIRFTVGGFLGCQLIAQQSGVDYYSLPQTFFPAGDPWTTYTIDDLTAADFDTYYAGTPGANPPDFSASGGPIQFGYVIWGGVYGIQSTQDVSGADNFSLTINSVPEPASFGIALTALAAFGWGAWRTRRTR